MPSEHLLLVDDSEAILRFERAVLGGRYQVSEASDGEEALQKLTRLRPDLVILDLSMPKMDGDEVLRRMQADPALRAVPVIIVSSEEERARACLAAGATAYLPKPLKAEELGPLVERILQQRVRAQKEQMLAVLPLQAAGVRFGVSLQAISSVHDMVATLPIPGGPSYCQSYLILRGAPILVVDVAKRLGRSSPVRAPARKLVILRREDRLLALQVDEVFSPEEIPAAEVRAGDQLGADAIGLLDGLLLCIAATSTGPLPVVDGFAFVARGLLSSLTTSLTTAARPRP